MLPKLLAVAPDLAIIVITVSGRLVRHVAELDERQAREVPELERKKYESA